MTIRKARSCPEIFQQLIFISHCPKLCQMANCRCKRSCDVHVFALAPQLQAVSKNGGGIWILSGKLATSVTLTHSIVFLFLLKSPKNFWCRNGTLCFPTKYSVPNIQRVIREYTFLFILSFLSLFATLPVVILGKNPQISESHLILLHCSYSHLVNCHGNICTFSFAPPHPNSFSSPITLVCKCLSPSLVFPKSSWLNCQHPLWSLPLPPCTSSWNLTFVMLYVFLKIFVGFLFPTS